MLAFTVELKTRRGSLVGIVRSEKKIVGVLHVDKWIGGDDFDQAWNVFSRWIAEESSNLRNRDIEWAAGWLDGPKIVFVQVRPAAIFKSFKIPAVEL